MRNIKVADQTPRRGLSPQQARRLFEKVVEGSADIYLGPSTELPMSAVVTIPFGGFNKGQIKEFLSIPVRIVWFTKRGDTKVQGTQVTVIKDGYGGGAARGCNSWNGAHKVLKNSGLGIMNWRMGGAALIFGSGPVLEYDRMVKRLAKYADKVYWLSVVEQAQLAVGKRVIEKDDVLFWNKVLAMLRRRVFKKFWLGTRIMSVMYRSYPCPAATEMWKRAIVDMDRIMTAEVVGEIETDMAGVVLGMDDVLVEGMIDIVSGYYYKNKVFRMWSFELLPIWTRSPFLLISDGGGKVELRLWATYRLW